MEKVFIICILATIICSCEIRYTNQEVKEMVVGDTVFCQGYGSPMHALITKNDTSKMIICFSRSWSLDALKYGQENCQTYSDFRIVTNY